MRTAEMTRRYVDEPTVVLTRARRGRGVLALSVLSIVVVVLTFAGLMYWGSLDGRGNGPAQALPPTQREPASVQSPSLLHCTQVLSVQYGNPVSAQSVSVAHATQRLSTHIAGPVVHCASTRQYCPLSITHCSSSHEYAQRQYDTQ